MGMKKLSIVGSYVYKLNTPTNKRQGILTALFKKAIDRRRLIEGDPLDWY
jgi:hypothetical protein